MLLEKSKVVPTAFWIGFLALGFATNVAAPGKHRVEHASRASKAVAVSESVIAQSEKPPKLTLSSGRQD
jgi:hypothetical protein